MNIFMINPVRNVTTSQETEIRRHVAIIENRQKDWPEHKVHFNMRDVDQTKDGLSICTAHRDAMRIADEAHVWWDPNSVGSHFDFGMAFALGVPLKIINQFESTPHKSYGNVLKAVAKPLDPTRDTL
jgi:hypothetical protein